VDKNEKLVMMETLGSLVDKLSILNIKLYFWENVAHDLSLSDEEVGKAKRVINVLNDQRNAIIEEIDCLFKEVVEGKKSAPPVYRQFKYYGKAK